MPEPKKDPSIADLIKEIEEVAAASTAGQAIPAGTVLDDAGQIVKLGEKPMGYEIIYGDTIELPDNLLPPVNQAE